MSNILFANNATTVLASPISSGATSVTLATGTGALFPSPTGSQYFLVTFVDAATGLLNEIVKVTARSGDTCTIVRAQESTSARAWLAGDTAANFWTAGSVTALQAGFPTGAGTISSSATLSSADAGTLFRVSGTGTTVSLPAASSVSGMAVGFSCQTLAGCTISSLGGAFAGGSPNGTTSISLAATDFVGVQSNGTVWVLFTGTPDVLIGGVPATQAWVTANFDPLGAAAAAQANAEAYALSLAGNLAGVQNVTVTTNFTGNCSGQLLRLISSAVANANFTIDVPTAGEVVRVENNTNAYNLTVRVDGTNRFFGFVTAGAYQSAAQATVILPPQSVATFIGVSSNLWLVSYNSNSFDTAGAAASALSAAEAYAVGLQGNLTNIQASTVSATYTSAAFGQLLRLQSTAAGNATFTVPAPSLGVWGVPCFWLQNNTSAFNLTIAVDGTNRFLGFVGATGYSATAQATIVLPPKNTAFIVGTPAGNWAVVWNSAAFANANYLQNKQVYGSAGANSFTVPAGVFTLVCECVGGGGAGGGSNAGYNGGAGGAGGFAAGAISVAPGATITCTVGAGGTPTTGNGGNGGTSSIGAFMSATGGGGGRGSGSNVAGGFGGTGTGGDVNYQGGAGTDGTLTAAFIGGTGTWTGLGGASAYGGGSRSGTIAGAANGAPGGGGGASYASASGTNGQPGNIGQIILRW